MKNEMTLAAAFRCRNKLKKLYNDMIRITKGNPVAVVAEDVDFANAKYCLGEFDKDVEFVIEVINSLDNLNTSIDEANAGARTLLNRIDACNTKISYLTVLTSKIKETKLYDTDINTVTGETIKTPLVPLYKNKWQKELLDARRELNECEEKLAEYNASHKVKFVASARLEELMASA